jgi:hypothetical protein
MKLARLEMLHRWESTKCRHFAALKTPRELRGNSASRRTSKYAASQLIRWFKDQASIRSERRQLV